MLNVGDRRGVSCSCMPNALRLSTGLCNGIRRRHSTTAVKATDDYEDAKRAKVLLSLIWLIHRVSAMPGIAGMLVVRFILS